jgi:hypothetical protein
MRLGDAKPQTRGDNARLEDLVEVVKMANGKWVQLRIIPSDVLSYRQHWINILASKTKREVRIPKLCLAHNPNTEELEGECPYCGIDSQTSTAYLVNVIVRQLQDDAPAKNRVTKEERESGFKNMESDSWTPVRVLRLTSGLMKKVQELKGLNKVKGKDGVKTFDVDHPKFGMDINIKYDGNAKGPEKYQINTGERSPLTEEEMQYLKWHLDEELITQMGLESLSEAKKELGRMQIVGAEEFDGDDDEDDLSSKKKKPAGKKPAPSKKRPVDEDDDEDDAFDDDEDDEPAPKKKAADKKPAPSKKRPADDEDDEDDEDFDDEDDEPAPRKKPVSKKRPVDEDEDDEDEDDEDFDDEDDEDDEPAPSKKPAGKKPAPSKKRPADEDDEDDDDFDDDDEDDEDDEPAPRKKPADKKPAPSKKPSSSKKRPADDEDDEDDDIPF